MASLIPHLRRPALTGLLLLLVGPLAFGESGRVRLIKTPDGGVQPQAVAGPDGTIHLVFLKGEPGGGDVFYTHAKAGDAEFSAPIRVNSQPGSAVAMGTIRGAQLALGRGGRVHVAWNGSGSAKPANPIKGSPMLYTRSDESRTAFEPQRNLMHKTFHLDGGGTVAADTAGNVYVAWHGQSGDSDGEEGRRMWVAHSTDDGATFPAEEPALTRPTGACPCCGTRAFVDSKGTLYALFRAAGEKINRDMILLTSRDRGERYRARTLEPWRIAICPMSSESLVEGPSGVLAAWETQGQVSFSRIDPKTLDPSPPVAPPGSGGDRKHPALAVNARGETILVWAEGTGWQRGGSLAWRIFDPSGKPTRESGRLEGGVPVWGLAAVVARPDGGFTIIH